METLSTLAFYDLETTGFSAKYNGVHEIGITTLHGDQYDIRLRPWGVVESAALAVCKKTVEELSAYQTEAAGVEEFKRAILELQKKYQKPVRLIGYCNRTFDNRFLLPLLERNGLRVMGLKLVTRSLDLRDCLIESRIQKVGGLAKMALRYGVPVVGAKLHGALYDSGLTASLFRAVYGFKA